MDINDSLFSQTIKIKLAMKTSELSKKINIAAKNNYTEKSGCILHSRKAANEISIESVGSTISDEALEKIYNDITKSQNPNEIKLSTTYKDFSPEEISKIKDVIYKIHNPESKTPEGEGSTDTPTKNKKSFISEFYDTESMFEYLTKINPEITKESGITHSQLIALTQNDDWEDSHYDFFGSLNRIFSSLDKDNDSTLTYDEIKAFIGQELGEEFTTYKEQVNKFTQELQSYYETLSPQEKLEFAIEKTREYLEAAGLTRQLEALERLLEMDDLYNDIHSGNISIANLNEDNDSGYTTFGSYRYYQYPETGIIAFDNDDNESDADLGITLDISFLQGKWYELVNTLVHELTHAAGALYYPCNNTPSVYTEESLNALYEAGAIDDSEKEWYKNNFDSISSEDSKWQEFFNKLQCLWGEYFAYQADADYNDSIGEDVYYTEKRPTTAVDGSEEKETIEKHIDDAYNYYNSEEDNYTEPVPDYKWWSYG